jgi:heptaprenyl diphosphate synthase
MINESNIQTSPPEYLTFEAAFSAADEEVERTLSASPALVRTYTRHLAASKGKFIRATSLLACAQTKDGWIHPNAVAFAAAIEILHLATLVHDDIIDNAETRRGSITLQKKYGKRTAVICGDYLLCAALKTAASIPNKKDYLDFSPADYMSRICLGELNQHLNNGNLDLSVYRYLKIISGKTAALFEASFYAGAVLCTDDRRSLAHYRRLGRYVGMIFQLTDDRIDFEADESAAKKPVQSDYEQGVITLPLIYALQNKPALKRKRGPGGFPARN